MDRIVAWIDDRGVPVGVMARRTRGPIYKRAAIARECNSFKDGRAYTLALPGNC